MSNKKILFLLGIVLILLVIVGVIFRRRNEPLPESKPSSETTITPSQSQSQFDSISELKRFYNQSDPEPIKDPEIIKEVIKLKTLQKTPRGDTLFYNDPRFQMVYFTKENQYLISILDSPFEVIRKIAEEELVKQLETDRNTVCTLNVIVTTPGKINPEEAGKTFKVSWCGSP